MVEPLRGRGELRVTALDLAIGIVSQRSGQSIYCFELISRKARKIMLANSICQGRLNAVKFTASERRNHNEGSFGIPLDSAHISALSHPRDLVRKPGAIPSHQVREALLTHLTPVRCEIVQNSELPAGDTRKACEFAAYSQARLLAHEAKSKPRCHFLFRQGFLHHKKSIESIQC